MTTDPITFTLAKAIEHLRARAPREQPVQLLPNAVWWLDVQAGTATEESHWAVDSWTATPDAARLNEAPYLAALGFALALQRCPREEALASALTKIARRAARTPERTGYADHPVVLAGLWLAARSLEHPSVNAFRTEARKCAKNEKTSAGVLGLFSTIEPDIAFDVGPIGLRSMAQLTSAVLLEHARPKVAEALYGHHDADVLRRRLLAAACEGKLDGLDDLEAGIAAIALRVSIANMTGVVDASSVEPMRSNIVAESATDTSVRCDVGVITIKDEEFEAVLEVFKDEPHLFIGPSTKRHYNLRRADAGGRKTYTIAIVRNVEQGNGDSQAVVRDMLEDLCPTLVLVVGIAGGRPTLDFTLGDVVLSTRVNDYSLHAVNADNETTFAVSGGPVASVIANGLANLKARGDALGDWTSELPGRPGVDVDHPRTVGPDDWQESIRKTLRHHFKDKPRSSPRFISGPIGSSDALIKQPERLISWLRTARNLLAVEMESAGVHKAARDRCSWLAIRGISDIVGLERDEEWTRYAAATAAAFARAYLRTTPIDPPPSSRAAGSGAGTAHDTGTLSLQRHLLEQTVKEQERANELVLLLKQPHPGTHAPAAFLANFQIHNHGERAFVLKDYWCEVLPSDAYRSLFAAPAVIQPLRCRLKLKTNAFMKPGNIGEFSLRLPLDEVRRWLVDCGADNPSIWNWTYVDLILEVRCEGGGNSAAHRMRVR